MFLKAQTAGPWLTAYAEVSPSEVEPVSRKWKHSFKMLLLHGWRQVRILTDAVSTVWLQRDGGTRRGAWPSFIGNPFTSLVVS